MGSLKHRDTDEGTLTYFVRVYNKRLNIVMAIFCTVMTVIVLIVLKA